MSLYTGRFRFPRGHAKVMWRQITAVIPGRMNMPYTRPSIAFGLLLTVLAACSQESGDIGLGPACEAGLDAGYRELNRAEVDGLSGSVRWSKAASLLATAKVQQQFEEYQNCIQKVGTARRHLSELRG